jgi:hypothetical protein
MNIFTQASLDLLAVLASQANPDTVPPLLTVGFPVLLAVVSRYLFVWFSGRMHSAQFLIGWRGSPEVQNDVMVFPSATNCFSGYIRGTNKSLLEWFVSFRFVWFRFISFSFYCSVEDEEV